MSNLFSIQQGTFAYVDGSVIGYKLRIDDKKLAKLVWRAHKNKNFKATTGCLTVETSTTTGKPKP